MPPPSSTSPTESSSSGISSQKSRDLGLDELIESLSFFVESSNSSSPTGGTGRSEQPPQETRRQNITVTNSNSGPLRSKRELIASMNGSIRRGHGDLESSPSLSSHNNNHSERSGGVSWSNQVMDEKLILW